MKIWSTLFAATLILAGVSAQFEEEDGFSIEMVDDDYDESEFGFTEAIDGPGPCNGFPEYRKLPINQAFYLGAHNAGSHVFDKACQSTQNLDITQMLQNGIRFLDINICKNQGQIVLCSSYDATPSTTPFSEVLSKVLEFSRNSVQQIIVLHLKSENVGEAADTQSIESTIDELCRIHSDLTLGTDVYEDKQCPFIYTYVAGKGAWPSMGELINYDPEMSQWVGDGENVGVRTKFLVTVADNIVPTAGYSSAYISPTFWRSLHKSPIQSFDDFKQSLKKECRVPAGGIGLEAYVSQPSCPDNQQLFNPEDLEDALLSRSGCNINDTPLNAFFNMISVDYYEKHLLYLIELEERMMELNYAKWSGNYGLISPSLLVTSEKKQIQRDEL